MTNKTKFISIHSATRDTQDAAESLNCKGNAIKQGIEYLLKDNSKCLYENMNI